MIAELVSAGSNLLGSALGGPPPSSTAYGGQTSVGQNNVTYNKAPNWWLLAGGALVALWLWKRKK